MTNKNFKNLVLLIALLASNTFALTIEKKKVNTESSITPHFNNYYLIKNKANNLCVGADYGAKHNTQLKQRSCKSSNDNAGQTWKYIKHTGNWIRFSNKQNESKSGKWMNNGNKIGNVFISYYGGRIELVKTNDGYYNIKLGNKKYCLTPDGNSRYSGAGMKAEVCSSSNDSQKYYFMNPSTPDGGKSSTTSSGSSCSHEKACSVYETAPGDMAFSGRYYKLKNNSTGKCLHTNTSGKGVLWDCKYATRWYAQKSGSIWSLKSGSKYLTAPILSQFTHLELRSSSSQVYFDLQPRGYSLKFGRNRYCIFPDGGKNSNGTQILTASCGSRLTEWTAIKS